MVKNKTPLHLAAQAGQVQNVEFLLGQGLDPNAKDQNGRTPLFLAVTQGQERIVKLLLDRKVATDTVATGGENLLHVAAFYGYLSILEDLFPFCSFSINAADDDGKAPIHKAVWGRPKPEVVNWLIAHGANSQLKNHFGYTPLHWAAKHGHVESAKVLLQSLGEINVNGETPIDLAIRFEQEEATKLLFEALRASNPKDFGKIVQGLFAKVVQQCCEIAGPAKTSFAIVALGDLAHGDILPHPTFEFAIFIGDAASKSHFQPSTNQSNKRWQAGVGEAQVDSD